jgi:hypothetical protein
VAWEYFGRAAYFLEKKEAEREEAHKTWAESPEGQKVIAERMERIKAVYRRHSEGEERA